MSETQLGIAGIVALFIFIMLGLPIAFAAALVGILGIALVVGFGPALSLSATIALDAPVSYALSVFPMFILVGYLVAASGFGEEMFHAVRKWMGHVRGGLSLAVVLWSVMFAATSGSSLAGVAMLTKIAMPEMRKAGYDDRLSCGVIAGSTTLAMLIPPSALLVLYAIIGNVPVGPLLMAGWLPGLMVAGLFLITVAVVTATHPGWAPKLPPCTMREKLVSLKSVWGMLLIFAAISGGIYSGVFTPTEAGVAGVSIAFILGIAARRLNLAKLKSSFFETAKTSCMVTFIIVAIFIFYRFMGYTGVTAQASQFISSLNVAPSIILVLFMVLYLILGTFLTGSAMVALTVPILLPIVVKLGYDPIWFGIFMVRVCEIGMLTPPLALNCIVLRGLLPDVSSRVIYSGMAPFLIADVVSVILLIAFPQIATFLPSRMSG